MDTYFSQQNHLGTITLNRPHALNALTLPMIKAMQEQLLLWQNDPAIHAVVLRSEGKAFCAGGDVRWLYEAGRNKDPKQLQFFWHEYRLNHYIHHFSKPYIVLIEGITLGGGIGISLHGVYPIATEHSSFAMPETGLGLFPDVGASYLLSRCPGELGVYLGLTGNRLTAADAFACQLIKGIVPSSHFDDLVKTLMQVDLSSDAFARVERCLQNFSIAPQNAPILDQLPFINNCFKHASVNEIINALTTHPSEWAHAVKQQLLQKSPLSLAVTFEQLQRAKKLNLAQCLQMDYGLVKKFMDDHDFYEGVRALLIDKDKLPQWQPASLAAVTPEHIAQYFAASSQKSALFI